ncbi:GAF domain-containing protein [Clostridium sp.]|uniref:GAF domain-containing protein n=1 Tax=Clostridium sp. TaxID=1506 RepID=UPI003464802F
MVNLQVIKDFTEEEKLKYMVILAEGQLSSEKNFIANLSNLSAIIKACIDGCNWVGFYLMNNGELVLGPFQGLPACNRIEIGKGVCGTSVLEDKVMRIEDVHSFEGHIACDSASNSEIVIPIKSQGKIIGVLDIDSPHIGRFSELEEKYLLKVVEKIEKYIN